MKKKKPKEFFSPSLNVTSYGLLRSKITAAELSKDLGFELGGYVNRLIEKKLNTVENSPKYNQHHDHKTFFAAPKGGITSPRTNRQFYSSTNNQ